MNPPGRGTSTGAGERAARRIRGETGRSLAAGGHYLDDRPGRQRGAFSPGRMRVTPPAPAPEPASSKAAGSGQTPRLCRRVSTPGAAVGRPEPDPSRFVAGLGPGSAGGAGSADVLLSRPVPDEPVEPVDHSPGAPLPPAGSNRAPTLKWHGCPPVLGLGDEHGDRHRPAPRRPSAHHERDLRSGRGKRDVPCQRRLAARAPRTVRRGARRHMQVSGGRAPDHGRARALGPPHPIHDLADRRRHRRDEAIPRGAGPCNRAFSPDLGDPRRG